MFENWSEDALEAIQSARVLSIKNELKRTTPRMVLLSLIGYSGPAKLFESQNVSLQNLKDSIENNVELEEENLSEISQGYEKIGFTNLTKDLIAKAIENANLHNHEFVLISDLLDGLLKIEDHIVLSIFKDLQVDILEFRKALLNEIENLESSEIFEESLAKRRVRKLRPKKKDDSANNTLMRRNELTAVTPIISASLKVKPSPALDNLLIGFIINITRLAKQRKLDYVVGRRKEFGRIIQILARRKKNNPILIGKPGVGKTSIIEGLALHFSIGCVPRYLSKKVILLLDFESIIASSRSRSDFDFKFKILLKRLTDSNRIILVLDEIHRLVSATASENALDVATILLRPLLMQGKIQSIGSSTTSGYKKHIISDEGLQTCFQSIEVLEPSVEETIEILESVQSRFENYHGILYTEKAVQAAAKMSAEYITEHCLPDKAIDLLDEAGARGRLKNYRIPLILSDLAKQLDICRRKKEECINASNFEGAIEEKRKEADIELKIHENKISAQTQDRRMLLERGLKVTESEVAEVVASWTGIPINKISGIESQNLLKIEETLHERIIGQHQAVTSVSKAIRRARVGLRDPNRPIASFIFAGPTGVGKTELTKAIAFCFFGSEDNMVRLDMSEYMERHTVAKLIGSPPGYIGHGDGGQLTDAVKNKPYTVVLFDEIEKAHSAIFDLLLQILEDGRLTDSKGITVSFKNTLIIMTSNVGAKSIEQFGSKAVEDNTNNTLKDKDNSVYRRIWNSVNKELKIKFRPEFLNRLDEIIVFSQLTKDDISQIAEIMINQLINRLWDQNGIILRVTDRVKEKITNEGFDPVYGARPLRRAVVRLLEDNLANELLSKGLAPETKVTIDVNNENNIKVFTV